jgi:hypothetical protein
MSGTELSSMFVQVILTSKPMLYLFHQFLNLFILIVLQADEFSYFQSFFKFD